MMCSCGCTDYVAKDDAVLFKNTMIGISYYMGCEDCEQAIGIDIDIMSKGESKFLDIDSTKIIDPPSGSYERLFYPVISVDGLKLALKHFKEHIIEYGNIEFFMEDMALDFLKFAVKETIRQYKGEE